MKKLDSDSIRELFNFPFFLAVCNWRYQIQNVPVLTRVIALFCQQLPMNVSADGAHLPEHIVRNTISVIGDIRVRNLIMTESYGDCIFCSARNYEFIESPR